MQPVRQLDDDDAGVLGDGEQELPVVLDLLLGGGAKGEMSDLGQAVYDGRDLGPELPDDILVRTSESSTTSWSRAAAIEVESSSWSTRIIATAMLWEMKSSPTGASAPDARTR